MHHVRSLFVQATMSEKQDEESDKSLTKSNQRDGVRRDESLQYKGSKSGILSPQRSIAPESDYAKSVDSRPRDDNYSDRMARPSSSMSIRRYYDDRGPRGRGGYRHSIRHGPPGSPRHRYDDRRPGPVRSRYGPPSSSSRRGDGDERFERHNSYR